MHHDLPSLYIFPLLPYSPSPIPPISRSSFIYFTYCTSIIFYFYWVPRQSTASKRPHLCRFRCRLYSPRTLSSIIRIHTVALLGCEWLPPCTHNQETVDSSAVYSTPPGDQICIMYSRLDYARRALSNFPMSHTGESVSGKLIHTRTPSRPEGEKERDLVRWSTGGDTRTNNNSAGQWSGISIQKYYNMCIYTYRRGVTDRIVVICTVRVTPGTTPTVGEFKQSCSSDKKVFW